MKKIIVLLALVVLLTGCSANVNIKITSSGIDEEIIINAYPDSGTTKEQLSKSFRKYMPVFNNVPLSDTEPDTNQKGVEYYIRRQNDLGSGYQFTYKYNYKFDDYKNARSVVQGFKSKIIQRNAVDKNIMISTDSSGLQYFDQYSNLETVTINIQTPYKVLKNNATYVNGNTYSWVMRRDSKNGIYMLIEDPNAGKDDDKPVEEKPEEPSITPIVPTTEKEESAFVKFFNDNPIVIGVIGILGFFILVLILSKVSKMKY